MQRGVVLLRYEKTRSVPDFLKPRSGAPDLDFVRTAGDRAHARGKGRHQRQSRPSILRHYGSVGGREGACFAATGSWTACSRRSTHAELRRLKTTPLMGPAPRRSALRANRRLVSAEMIMAADATKETA